MTEVLRLDHAYLCVVVRNARCASLQQRRVKQLSENLLRFARRGMRREDDFLYPIGEKDVRFNRMDAEPPGIEIGHDDSR